MVDFREMSVRFHQQLIVEALFSAGLYTHVMVLCREMTHVKLLSEEMYIRMSAGDTEIKYKLIRPMHCIERTDPDGKESKMMFVGPAYKIQGLEFDLVWLSYDYFYYGAEQIDIIRTYTCRGYNPMILGDIR